MPEFPRSDFRLHVGWRTIKTAVTAMLVAMVLLGVIKRIGSVSEKLVPFMALFYIVLAVGVVVLNVERLPYVLESIFAGAFNPTAFTGGAIGSLFISMQKGVSRGIFSNEAGLGTGSIADTFNGLMSIPNLIALLLLSGTVVKLTREFFASEG